MPGASLEASKIFSNKRMSNTTGWGHGDYATKEEELVWHLGGRKGSVSCLASLGLGGILELGCLMRYGGMMPLARVVKIDV